MGWGGKVAMPRGDPSSPHPLFLYTHTHTHKDKYTNTQTHTHKHTERHREAQRGTERNTQPHEHRHTNAQTHRHDTPVPAPPQHTQPCAPTSPANRHVHRAIMAMIMTRLIAHDRDLELLRVERELLQRKLGPELAVPVQDTRCKVAMQTLPLSGGQVDVARFPARAPTPTMGPLHLPWGVRAEKRADARKPPAPACLAWLAS